MDKGITCVEAFDYDVADRIYAPYDNLVLSVTLHEDGRTDRRVLGSLTEKVGTCHKKSIEKVAVCHKKSLEKVVNVG